MTPTAPSSLPALSKPRRKREPSVVIPNVEWETYEKLLEAFGDRRNARLAYDRGDLEIMVPSNEHEEDADFLGDLVKVLAEEMKLPLRAGGSFTMKRRDAKRGIEPDRCFWITSAAKVAGVRKIDLARHAPPDLAIEVDVTSSSIDKFGIYAKLGVSELWRLTGDDLRFHRLGERKKYVETAASLSFAGVAPGDLIPHLIQRRGTADQVPIIAAFRAWVKQRAATPPSSPIM
jgi:Uma2 family endonuclease